VGRECALGQRSRGPLMSVSEALGAKAFTSRGKSSAIPTKISCCFFLYILEFLDNWSSVKALCVDVAVAVFWGYYSPNPVINSSLPKLATDEHARASTTAVAPVTNQHHEYCGGGAFATIVLGHAVQDVAFALVSRWPFRTLYPRVRPASQAGSTRPTKYEALRGAHSSAARWQIFSQARGRV
jgi:hypothetical protein